MNNKEIEGYIVKNNNIGEIKEINEINEGVINDNFIVKTNKGKFFIKKYSDDLADSKIEYIKEIENFMSNNDIPAIKSIINDKEHKISIYPFIESNRSHDYNEKDYFLIGQMLAKIHKASFNIDLPKELKQFGFENKSTENNSSKTTKYIEDINSKHSLSEIDLIYKEYLEKKLNYSKKFEYKQEIQNDVIIHGDYHPANLFFNKDKTEIVGICDWEKAGYAPRTYDFAKSYLNLSFGSGEENIDICLDIKRYLTEGYRTILELSDEDINNGIKLRIKDYLFDSSLEDRYFINNDNRSNKFVKNWIRILDFFCQDNLF